MTPETNTLLNTITSSLGVKNFAELALHTPAEIYRRLRDAKQECSWSDLEELHAKANKEYDNLRILDKSILTRSSPLLPEAVRQGLKQPDVSLQDYDEWFGRSASRYVKPGDVSSMFSPAAYLTELYREARKLYPAGARHNIDTRRPDLKNLLLNQENMNVEVSALKLSNEILLAHGRDQLGSTNATNATDGDVLKELSNHLKSSGTPYHHHYDRLREARNQRDPDYVQMLAAPAVSGHLSGPSQAAIRYNISPALYQLLTEKIEADDAEEIYKKHFGDLHPNQLINPVMLRRWYGLTDEEVLAFMNSTYKNNSLTTVYKGQLLELSWTAEHNASQVDYVRLYPIDDDSFRLECRFIYNKNHGGRVDIQLDNKTVKSIRGDYKDFTSWSTTVTGLSGFLKNGYPQSLSLSVNRYAPEGGYSSASVIFSAQNLPAYAHVLKLNKVIRLYKATGLSPRVLGDIVNSVDLSHMTEDTLSLLFHISLLMQRYGVSHEDALVIARGKISLTKNGPELSQWDRLFNDPPLVEDRFTISNKTINFDPTEAGVDSEIKATFKRACQTDDMGMWSLVQCAYHNSDQGKTPDMSLNSVSCLYGLSLWARLHSLTPAELHTLLLIIGLPDDLTNKSTDVWIELQDKLYSTVQWLNTRSWTVHDLHILTRDVTTIPTSVEISNFIQQVREFILSSELPADSSDEVRITRLAPLIAAVFNLNNDTAAVALLHWANKVKPGGTGLGDFWRAIDPVTGKSSNAADVTAFAYCLAQMALIYHGTGVEADALKMFVENPETLDVDAAGTDGALLRNLSVVRKMGEFSQWMSMLNDAQGEIIAALSAEGINAALLARASSNGLEAVKQAMLCNHERKGQSHPDKVVSYGEVQVVMQWCGLSASFNVMPLTIDQMLKMDYVHGEDLSHPWENWKNLADAFTAGLTQKQKINVDGLVGEALSSALCGYLFTSDSNFSSFINDRESLYQYLLADNLNSAQVKTTRLAEAISALQTFIQRTLSSPELPRALDRTALGRQFLTEWQEWNSRYSHWVAYRKLMFYPENYLDPTTRLGQTPMMDDMLQVLGQTQINEDTVSDGFMGYLASFEEVANLETLCGFHDNPDASSGKTWFIGYNQNEVREYWWRTVDEDKREAATGNLPANAWTSWEKINCAAQVWNNHLRPVVYKSRLYLVWIERMKEYDSDGSNVRSIYRYQLKISGLRYDGNWSAPVSKDITDDFANIADKAGMYVSVWSPTDSILVLTYKQDDISDKAKGWSVFDNMHIEDFPGVSSNLEMLDAASQLQKEKFNPVINVFTGAQVAVEKNWASQGYNPPEFSEFSLRLDNVTVETSEDDSKYSLELQVRATLNHPPSPGFGNQHKHLLSQLMNEFPEVGNLNKECTLWVYGSGQDSITKGVYQVVIDAGDFVYFVRNNIGLWEGGGFKFANYSDTSIKNSPITPIIVKQANFLGENYFVTLGKLPISPDNRVHSAGHIYLRREVNGGWGIMIAFAFAERTLSGVRPNNDFKFLIKKEDIKVSFDSETKAAQSDYIEYNGMWTGTFTHQKNDIPLSSWTGNSHRHKVIFSVKKGNTTYNREYQVNVYRSATIPLSVTIENSDFDVQTLVHTKNLTRLNTLFARQLTERASTGIRTILNWDTQQLQEPPLSKADLTITLPVYDAVVHGADASAAVYLNPGDEARRITLWKGELNSKEKTQASVTIPTIAAYAVEGHYHLEVGYEKGINDAGSERSIMLSAENLSVIRGPDAGNNPLSRDSVNNVVINGTEGWVPMDFAGANGLYFWELFYYTPMMIMQRFLQEESFDKAEQWLQYIFNPAGYMNGLVRGERLWGVRPLEEDTSWNDNPLNSYDPDAVAQNDPMHYKLHVFMRLLDIIVGKGDAAYRKLERDTLSEAKVWYTIALNMLGEEPWIEPGAGWGDPTLGMASDSQGISDRLDALSQMSQGICSAKHLPLADVSDSTLFFPESNAVMLGYWETLRVRLFNLRNNLTIDGQPINLPIFAPPADPKALLAAAIAAEGGSGSELPSINSIPALRFTSLLESARSMASQLIGFGNSMQQILITQDAEALAELLATQGAEIASSSLSLQKQTLNELASERVTLEKSLETATARHNHYRTLYDQNMNPGEMRAMTQLQQGQNTIAGARGALIAGAALNMVPNVFGLANGGAVWGAVAEATAIGFTIDGEVKISGATRLAQEEQYRRRREDWEIQYRTAEKEILGIEAQLNALSVRETSAQMQIAHMETQSAHAKAQLALLNSKFTGKAMYSWMRGRLATIFYQYYDLTASLCLMAQKSLQWEKGDNTSYLKTGTWNGAWAGLMSGEGLMLSLAQMEMAWMKHQKRELEVTRTVSLAAFLADRLDDFTLSEAVKSLLEKGSDDTIGEGNNKLALSENQLAVHFSLKDLGLMADYASEGTGRVRSIAITLPALLGPYQNIRGRLRTDATMMPVGCNECAISHAMQDSGLFVYDGSVDSRWGARWLPFEGLDVSDDENNMTLSFADATGDQKALLESLSDIILHVQFTVR